jgi:cyclic beta-1,2-glucan synthetase
MAASPLIAGLAALLVTIVRPDALAGAAPMLALWVVAPVAAYWLSMPVGPRQRPLSEWERTLLRRTARATWRYFETFITAENAWLPPDNYQESGDLPQLARRT